MPNVLIRDLPDDVHVDLQHRAQARGQSLQQYLASELTRLARTPTLEQVLARIGGRRGGSVGFEAAVAYDASYVAVAEALDCVLVTADGKLARANGPRCRVEVLAH